MNYRHAYHAGNFADVFKHCVLVGLLESLKGKQKPFCVIDTHAGAGRYDLQADAAMRTGEAHQGVMRLTGALRLPAMAHIYLNLVHALNEGSARGLRYYPGSPLLAASLLRADDRLVLCELQDEETLQLRREFRQDRRVHVHQRDGYQMLRALLPPAERRGLVLIDPPYEAQEQEFSLIRATLDDALQRWPTGIYAVWYPIKLRQSLQPFHRYLRECAGKRVCIAELCLHPDNSALRLNGCGLAIINSPWRFELQLRELLAPLHGLLAEGRCGRFSVEMLREEAS